MGSCMTAVVDASASGGSPWLASSSPTVMQGLASATSLSPCLGPQLGASVAAVRRLLVNAVVGGGLGSKGTQ
jgi:hypothetical protein